MCDERPIIGLIRPASLFGAYRSKFPYFCDLSLDKTEVGNDGMEIELKKGTGNLWECLNVRVCMC